MVYAQLVYLAVFPDTGGLEDAAEFVAKHPENKVFATTEHSDGNDEQGDAASRPLDYQYPRRHRQ
jgi:hypothetical protein